MATDEAKKLAARKLIAKAEKEIEEAVKSENYSEAATKHAFKSGLEVAFVIFTGTIA